MEHKVICTLSLQKLQSLKFQSKFDNQTKHSQYFFNRTQYNQFFLVFIIDKYKNNIDKKLLNSISKYRNFSR